MAGPTVILKGGTIAGTTGKNLDGEEFYKFLGVPYAKPPLGPLRFKAPQPAEPWQGVKDCTKDGNSSVSLNIITQQLVGSEDCLYLNVHTKALPKPGSTPKPVMFFIHGGAFTLGTGTQEFCDPEYFLTQDIVLVTINYRLGILGFLSLDDTSLEVPGNAGLKDQTMALRWVQENISNFNGDPDNVTIFGISAGGAAVEFQMLSPSAKGLFHKAIAQSGSSLNTWAWGQRNAIPLAEKLGHKVTNEKDALEVLLKEPADTFGTSLFFSDVLVNSYVRRPFGPVIEKPNPTAFLTEDPYVLLSEGRFIQVPYIQGVCSREGRIFEMFKQMVTDLEVDTDKNLLPWNLKSLKQRSQWSQRLKNLYFEDGVTKDGIYDFMGDSLFTFGVLESTRLIQKHAQHPQYFYIFNYNTDLSSRFREFLRLDNDVVGTCHGGDQGYMLPSHFPGVELKLSKEDVKAIKRVIQIWTDFARNGQPHADWSPVTDAENIEYLVIDKELEMLTNPFEERMKVWRKLLEEAGGLDFSLQEHFE